MGWAYSQQINLEFQTQPELDIPTLEALSVPKKLESLDVLNSLGDSLQGVLARKGYLDISTPQINQVNDTLYILGFDTGERYKTIRVNYDPSVWDKRELRKLISRVEEDHFVILITNPSGTDRDKICSRRPFRQGPAQGY